MPPQPSLHSLFDRLTSQQARIEASLVLFLDQRLRIIAASLTEGGRDRVELSTAAILDCGWTLGAREILLFHTHPSGDPRPSRSDVALTRRLCAGLRRQQQRLTDHIILANSGFFSFRANGLL